MSLDTSISFRIAATLTSALDLATLSVPLDKTYSDTLSDGTGANQATKIFHDTRTLAASGTETLDLAGSLTDATGQTLTFAKIKVVFFRAADGNTNSVQVTRPASNGVALFMAAGDGISLLPGGKFVWWSPNATGVTVTAGTGDLITVTNSAGSTGVTYDVIIIGT